MESVLVIGAGYMGTGIAQVCAQAGYQVHLMDVKPEALKRAEDEVQWSLQNLHSKGKLSENPGAVLERVKTEDNMKSAATATWVIETAFEIESLKKDIFEELDRLALPETPLASNTSTIPIHRIAKATKHPERVLGLHFFPPVPLMGLIEVIKGKDTSDQIFERGVDFGRSVGKRPIRVLKDIPGFVMNRIWISLIREAVDLVAEGIATPDDVDVGMQLGFGFKRGPFEMADHAGVDTYALGARSMKALGAKYLAPRSDLLDRMVKEGRLGKKVGKGFYRYTADGKRMLWDEKEPNKS